MPEVPSLAELGLQGVDLEAWNAVAVPAAMPAAMPAALVTPLAAQASGFVRSAEMRQDTALLGGVITRQSIRNE